MLFSSLGPGCATSAEADELNDASTAGKLDRFTDLKPIIRHLPHAVSTSFRLRFKSQSPGSRRARLRRHRGRHAVDPDTIAGADAGQVIGDGDEGRALSRRPAPYGLGGPRPRAHRKAHRARAQQPRAQQPRAQQRRQPRWTDEPRPAALGSRPQAVGIPRRPACGYDGQAAARLAHIPTGATAATGSSIRGDSGGLSIERNTP